jgi:hypothetical protein
VIDDVWNFTTDPVADVEREFVPLATSRLESFHFKIMYAKTISWWKGLADNSTPNNKTRNAGSPTAYPNISFSVRPYGLVLDVSHIIYTIKTLQNSPQPLGQG